MVKATKCILDHILGICSLNKIVLHSIKKKSEKFFFTHHFISRETKTNAISKNTTAIVCYSYSALKSEEGKILTKKICLSLVSCMFEMSLTLQKSAKMINNKTNSVQTTYCMVQEARFFAVFL